MLRAFLTVCAVGAAATIGASGYYYYNQPTVPMEAAFVPREVPAVPQPVHTVQWFHQHQDRARQVNEACDNDPGFAMHDPECLAADQAREYKLR